jgi:hypothetical protein
VTDLWLEQCVNDDTLHGPDSHPAYRPLMCPAPLPIPAFAAVLCCISQYSKTERCAWK